MKKGNIIDLITYRDQGEAPSLTLDSPISDELKNAIQTLIDRLRDSGPIQQSS